MAALVCDTTDVVIEMGEEDTPEILGFAEADAHPPDPLPIGKGELSKRGVYTPS